LKNGASELTAHDAGVLRHGSERRRRHHARRRLRENVLLLNFAIRS